MDYGYKNIEGSSVGIYVYTSTALEDADGRLQSELSSELEFPFEPSGMKMEGHDPTEVVITKVFDVTMKPLHATPVPLNEGQNGRIRRTYYGLTNTRTIHLHLKPYQIANTTIISNLHKYDENANLR